MKGLSDLPWRRIATWGVLLGMLWVLHDLFPVIFLTFVLAYIANSIVTRLERVAPYRRFYTVLVFLGFLGGLVLVVSFLGPRVYAHALVARRSAILFVQSSARPTHPPDSGEAAPGISLPPRGTTEAGAAGETKPPVPRLLQPLFRTAFGEEAYEEILATPFAQKVLEEGNRLLAGAGRRIASEIGDVAVAAARLVLYAFISTIFAFLVVWDHPKIASAFRRLEDGPFRDTYREVAPMLRSFGSFVGKAFEAQAAIAVVNTLLTTVAMVLLGIPEIALLATIVFFFSFIPVFGVVCSTIPIAYFAFQAMGWMGVLAVVVLVLVIHAVEAYILNPIIYGQAFHTHPLLVLVLLLVGEHFFGVWGLLLAVPVGVYVIRRGILGEEVSA